MRRLVECLLLLACVAPVAAVAQAGPARPPVLPAATHGPAPDLAYVLGPGDKLRIITFGEERLSGEFVVNERGRVSLPLVGEVNAGGLTLERFSTTVQEAMGNGFLLNPRVSVEVLNYRPFYIMGEVVKPGEYPFINGLTVTNAVATAGGFTYRANIHRVFVRGQAENGEHVVTLNGLTPVHPGDTIRIPERLF